MAKNNKTRLIKSENIGGREEMEVENAVSGREWPKIFDSMADGVSIHGINHDIFNVNKSLCVMLGKSSKELIGKKCFKIFHGKNQPIKECPMAAVLKSGQEKRVEIFEPKFNKWLSIYSSSIKNKGGSIVKIIHVVRDITERKQAEAEIIKRNKELEILRSLGVELSSVLEIEDAIRIFSEHLAKIVNFDAITFIIINPDEAGKVIYSSFLNYKVSEQYINSIKASLIKFFARKKQKGLLAITHIIKNIRPHIFGKKLDNNSELKFKKEFIYTLKIGGETLGLIQLTVSEKGVNAVKKKDFINAMAANLSISISRLQTIVRSQNTKTSSLIESLNDGIIMYDAEKNIVLMNSSVIKYLNISEKAVSLENIYHLFAEQKMSEKISLSLEKGEIFNLDEVILNEYHFEIFIIPVKDVSGKIVGGAIIFRDITSLKKIDQMKTEFVSVASHQLRTPLTAIKLFTGMLMNGEVGKLNLRQAEYLDNIYESTERMVRLVNDLLNVTRIESGRLRVAPEPTILKDFVNAVISEAKPLADNKNVKIDFVFDNDLTKIPLDQNLMRQVIYNLLINAIRYSKINGGQIVIAIKRKNNDLFLITVKDNGIGIPRKIQNRIFEKFFRADNAIKSVTEGTGLGLYVSKMIVESSGGRIWFESEKNKGSCFFIEIPVKGMEEREGERGLAIS